MTSEEETSMMEDVDPEVCEQEVMEVIAELSSEELVNLCLELGVTGYDAFRHKKAKMHKFVMKYLLDLEDSDDDGGAAKFVQIYNYFKANPTDLASKTAHDIDVDAQKFNDQLAAFTDVLATSVGSKKIGNEVVDEDPNEVKEERKGDDVPLSTNWDNRVLKLLEQHLEQQEQKQVLVSPSLTKTRRPTLVATSARTTPPVVTTPSKKAQQPDLVTSLLQADPDILVKLLQQQLQTPKKEARPALVMKDLKFTGGVIAGEGEATDGKTRFTFSTLCYKIRNAEKQKYPEPVICNAIIDAIVPSNPLKTYFEMRPDLTIKAMLSKLKNLYKEKGSTETLLELSQAAQYTTETCLEFCGRLMCLRDKFIMLSKEENATSTSRMAGLSETFMKSLFLGMRNGNV